MVHSVNKICCFQVVCVLLKLRKHFMMLSPCSVGMLTQKPYIEFWESIYSSLILKFVTEFANVMELNVRNSLGRFKNSLHILHYITFIFLCIISNLVHSLLSLLSGWWHTTYYLHTSLLTLELITKILYLYFKFLISTLNHVFIKLNILRQCICAQTFVVSRCIDPL